MSEPGTTRITNDASLAWLLGAGPAGDTNGDGVSDFAVGNPHSPPESPGDDPRITGVSVIFGTASGLPGTLDVAELDGSNGFRFESEFETRVGNDFHPLGDVNGDGLADMILSTSGDEAYVLIGTNAGFPTKMTVDDLTGGNGFVLRGAVETLAGLRTADAGDVNDDGMADILVSALHLSPDGQDRAGGAYLLFGQSGGFGAEVDLTMLDGTNGFAYVSEANGDRAGRALSGAVDINNDGYDDILIGSSETDRNGQFNPGVTHLVLGGPTLSLLDQSDGLADGVIPLASIRARLTTTNGDDTLPGGAGKNTLDSGAGDDWLIGQDGGDLLIVDSAGDRIGESRRWEGRDTVESSVDFDLGRQHVEDLVLTGDARMGTGNGLDNAITGTSGNDTLDGGRGMDALPYMGIRAMTHISCATRMIWPSKPTTPTAALTPS